MNSSSDSRDLLVPTRVLDSGEVSGNSSTSTPRPRCAIALVTGSADHLSQETVDLLRRRLRIASLIALGPFTFFLALALTELRTSSVPPYIPGLVVQTLVVLLQALLAVLLWRNQPLSACHLRKIELLLFGSIATFFAWIQFLDLVHVRFLDWARPGIEDKVAGLAFSSFGLRWFFLIVLYGVFIPNTWRRCAVLVGLAALTPLALTLTVGVANSRLRPYLLTPALVQTAVIGAGAAIAIFGSRRIHLLETEASQARHLGRYRLHERLGAGGMGEVYLGEHTLLRRPCAIKVIHADHAADATQLSRFEREVRAMARLTHWNTVEVFDYGQTDDGTFYYVMEYLPGQDLETLVNHQGPLPPGRVIHFLRQVCGALREAHGIGMLHRDIKPSNVMTCHRGGLHDVVKLLDFGLVHCLGNKADVSKLTVQGTILGSPPYMSPEQSRGRADLDARTDIYSLGGVAYYLLTGQTPFVRDTVMEMLIAHASEKPTPPSHVHPEVPRDLDAIVLRCLEKDREQRFRDVEELDRALSGCACAGGWTEDLAADWWAQHGETVSLPASSTSAAEGSPGPTVAASA
jgi:eukaryotic-like serine/threonine-protein kinase